MDAHEFAAGGVALLDRQGGVGAAREGGQDGLDRGGPVLVGIEIS
jgi:hypothetical protein